MAAVHALKIADAFCKTDKNANVLIVCIELCTLHFQKENTVDNITSSMLFGDGAAAVLVTGNEEQEGLTIDHFIHWWYKKENRIWHGNFLPGVFLMTLSSYVADVVEENFNELVNGALADAGLDKETITHWCIHPEVKKY